MIHLLSVAYRKNWDFHKKYAAQLHQKLNISDGSGLRFFGLGRARAFRFRARVGPRPDFEGFFRAGSGFAFSGSGRARVRVKNTVLAYFGLWRHRRSPTAPKSRSLGKF